MHRLEAIITDLDGTVVLPDGTVSAGVESIMTELHDSSVVAAPVTGRDYHSATQMIQPLGFRELGVFSGGASIVDLRQKKIIWEQRIDQQTTHRVVSGILPYSEFIGFGKGRRPVSQISLNDVDSDSYGVWAEVKQNKIAEVLDELASISGIQTHQNQGPIEGLVGVHITHIDANKYSGSLRMLGMLGILPENTLAIGDGDNDLPLFACAGLKVAMGNASPLLKAKADHIVGTVYDDGFVDAMRQFVL